MWLALISLMVEACFREDIMAAKHATINVYVGMALSKIWLEGEHVPLVLRRKEKGPK